MVVGPLGLWGLVDDLCGDASDPDCLAVLGGQFKGRLIDAVSTVLRSLSNVGIMVDLGSRSVSAG